MEEDPDAPPEGKAYEDLKEAGTWVHAELDINTVGRTQPTPGKGEDEGEHNPQGERTASLQNTFLTQVVCIASTNIPA